MLATLLANNPGLLLAMSAPPPPGAATVASSSQRTSPEPSGAEAAPLAPGHKRLSDGGGSSDDTTAPTGVGSPLQASVPRITQPYKPVPMIPPPSGVRAPIGLSVSATAPAPGITCGGSAFTSAALISGSRSLSGNLVREPTGGTACMTRTGSDGWAGFKRSFSEGAKDLQRPLATPLPRKKRGNAAALLAVGSHDAEHAAYSSLTRMRELGESATLPMGTDYSLDPGGGAGSADEDALMAAGGGKCSKEKNREAQRRFRERQKSLIGDLREMVNALTREGHAQSKRVFGLQEENRLLKMLLNTARTNAQESAAGGSK